MAEASNCLLGCRNFQMMSLKRLSLSASTSSAFFLRGGRISRDDRRLKSCCINGGPVNFDGVRKEKAFAPSVPRVLRVPGEVVNADNPRKNLGDGSVNGWDRSSLGKIVIAVDVDEVLGNFLSALNQFIADRYSRSHSVSEYHVYEFFKIWNCSRSEATTRVHEFFETPYFTKGIYPIPGAREALQKLSQAYSLSVVTSRQNAIQEHTINWIEKHYPGLFQEIHFGNHFALDGKSRPKSEICRSLGAKILIDDNPRYAAECADNGIKVLLFNYQNSYPWCKTEAVSRHPLVTEVRNWEEVEHQLVSWAVHR